MFSPIQAFVTNPVKRDTLPRAFGADSQLLTLRDLSTSRNHKPESA
jgi:hypothetical protein